MISKEKEHKELKNGLTTGTCASAVAKAAVCMLVNQEMIKHVTVTLPSGSEVILEINDSSINNNQAQCATIKDAGDDPDITHGATICASAKFIDGDEIKIIGGKGIGKVTKPGLAVEVGQPAINPVPLKMIKQSIADVLPQGKGVEVKISIPEGEKLAKKTFNPQLGIVSGLSVLGTTGIVKPMSEEALKDSLVVKLNQIEAYGFKEAIFSPGNYSTSFSKENLNINEEWVVLTSNYIGFMLEQAIIRNFNKVVIVGHLGKLIKIAGGIFHTHSRIADARNEIMASHYFKFSKDVVGFDQIMQSNTTEEAISFVKDSEFWNNLANTMKQRAELYAHGDLEVEIVLLSQKAGLLATTSQALSIINNIHHGK